MGNRMVRQLAVGSIDCLDILRSRNTPRHGIQFEGKTGISSDYGIIGGQFTRLGFAFSLNDGDPIASRGINYRSKDENDAFS